MNILYTRIFPATNFTRSYAYYVPPVCQQKRKEQKQDCGVNPLNRGWWTLTPRLHPRSSSIFPLLKYTLHTYIYEVCIKYFLNKLLYIFIQFFIFLIHNEIIKKHKLEFFLHLIYNQCKCNCPKKLIRSCCGSNTTERTLHIRIVVRSYDIKSYIHKNWPTIPHAFMRMIWYG